MEIKRSRRIHIIIEEEKICEPESRPMDFINESAPVDTLTWEKVKSVYEEMVLRSPSLQTEKERANVQIEAFKSGLIDRSKFKMIAFESPSNIPDLDIAPDLAKPNNDFTIISTTTGRTSSGKPNYREIEKRIAASVEITMSKKLQAVLYKKQRKGAKK